MSKAVSKIENVGSLAKILESKKMEIAKVASSHLSVDRLLKLMVVAASRTPKILECDQVSIAQFVMKCSETGLEPIGAGGAWAIPFENRKLNTVELQFIPDYRGLIHAAKRAGAIVDCYAEVVKANDEFDYELGLEPKLFHKPASKDRGELTNAYCVMKMPDGDKRFVVMDAEEIASIRKRSRAANNGPWVTDEAEMWKKSCVRRAMKPFAGIAPELTAAIELDNEASGIEVEPKQVQMPKAISKTEPEPQSEPEPEKPSGFDPIDGLNRIGTFYKKLSAHMGNQMRSTFDDWYAAAPDVDDDDVKNWLSYFEKLEQKKAQEKGDLL